MNSENNFVMLCATAFLSPAEIPLLRSALAQFLDWQRIDHEANRQCVFPIVANVLLRHAGDLLPDQVIATCKNKVRDTTKLNLIWLQEWQHLLQLLDDAAIPVISFKGPALALTAYGDLTLREFHDLDLLVHPRTSCEQKTFCTEPATRCGRLSWGFRASSSTIQQSTALFHPSHSRNNGRPHPDLHEVVSFQLEFDDVFASAKLEQREEVTFLALSPEHSLLYLCAHGAKNCWAHCPSCAT